MSTPIRHEHAIEVQVRMIAEAGTIVVKVGSSSLTQPSGHLDPDKLERAGGGLRSGAIDGRPRGAGLVRRHRRRFRAARLRLAPGGRGHQQACAAVGQGLLMAQYETAFGRYGIRVGQILITVPKIRSQPQQYRNVRTHAGPSARPRRGADHQRKRFVRLQRDPFRRQRPTLRAGRQHGASPTRLVLLTDVDALYTAPPKRTRLATHRLCAERRGRAGERCRSAAPARTWAPAAWSPKSRPRAWRRSPAFPRCSPARRTQARR
jgi:glutamate 5-kinase